MRASASVPGHLQSLALSLAVPPMAEPKGHTLQQTSPPTGSTVRTLHPLQPPPGSPDWFSCLEGPPQSRCWVTYHCEFRYSWWCLRYTESPSRHSSSETTTWRITRHGDTGVDNLVVSLSPILVISFPPGPQTRTFMNKVHPGKRTGKRKKTKTKNGTQMLEHGGETGWACHQGADWAGGD